jgi:hypothetical protein
VFDITVVSISIDIEMSTGVMDQQQVIMFAEDEETMQGMEDSIECQDKLEQGGQFFDALCLEYQGKEVLSGRDNQAIFEAILDVLTEQGALSGFGAYMFAMHVIQQKKIEDVSVQCVDRTRILEALVQKADENVRDHHLRIIELESGKEKAQGKYQGGSRNVRPLWLWTQEWCAFDGNYNQKTLLQDVDAGIVSSNNVRD